MGQTIGVVQQENPEIIANSFLVDALPSMDAQQVDLLMNGVLTSSTLPDFSGATDLDLDFLGDDFLPFIGQE